MKNKIKILANIISAVVLFVLVLPLALSLLLNIPFVQNAIVRKLSEVATEALGSKVSVERVGIKLFYTATVDGFFVEDPIEGDTLMYINTVSARLKNFDFTSGVNIAYAVVDSGCLYLNNDTSMVLNLKYITDKLKPKKPRDPNKIFRLNIDDIDIQGFDFEFRDVVRYAPKEYGINYQDMRFEDIRVLARDFKLVTDSINMSVDSLAFTEKSGFEVVNITTDNLRLSPSGITVSKADVQFGNSRVALDEYAMKFTAWNMADYINKVAMSAKVEDCRIDFQDIAQFTPTRQPWRSVVQFKGDVEGTVADMKATIFALKEEGGVSIDEVAATVRGLPDVKKCLFDVTIAGAKSSVTGIDALYENFTGKKAQFTKPLSKLTELQFNGAFKGSFSDFASKGMLQTNLGALALNLVNKPVKEGMRLKGGVTTNAFMIGKMLGVKNMGSITLTADMNALVGKDTLNVVTAAKIASFDYNDYRYRDVNVDGTIVDKTFYGYIGCRDENIDFDFNGQMQFGIEVPEYDFNLKAYNVNLAALNFNKRDSVSLVSMRLTADGSGLKLDNMNGRIEIDSLRYINPVDTVTSGRIVYTTRNSENSKFMRFDSDFADIELQGQQSYTNIFRYLINTVQKYLPSLQEGVSNYNRLTQTAKEKNKKKVIVPKNEPIEAAENSYYIVSVNVKKVNNVAGIFIPGLEVSEGTKLSFVFNPAINEFMFTFNSDYVSRKNMLLSNINIDSRASQDSISIYVRSKEMIFNNIFIPNFLLVGGIKDNSVLLDARFHNENDQSGALVATRSLFERDPQTGVLQLKVNVLPSRLSLDGQTWSAASSTILLDPSRINISKFYLYSDKQVFTLWGDISANQKDTLHLGIANLNLAPFSAFTDSLGFKMGGILNGRVSAVSLLKDPHFLSELTFKGVTLNDRTFNDAVFTSGWSEARRSLTFSLRQDGEKPLIEGAYRPIQKLLYADVDMKEVDLSLISPFMKGISHDTRGSADVVARVSNPNSRFRIDGKVDIRNFETTIDFTNVRYSASGHVDIENNNFLLKDGVLTDEMGVRCALQGEVHAKNFKNVDYSLSVFPSKMLCMNTTITDNDIFYGRLFCSGEVSIIGHGTNVLMNVNAASENNSTFFMPLSGKSTMREVDFIKFVSQDSSAVDPVKRSFILRQQKQKRKNTGLFTMNMNLNLRPNVEAQIVIDPTVGNIIKGRGTGELKIYAQPMNDIFLMHGGVEIVEGSYLFTLQNIINKYFKIKEGSTISWNGDPLDAKLNITATYLVKTSLAPLLGNDPRYSKRVDVDCNLNLTGQLLRPDINLGISVPYAEPEIQSLVNSVLNTEESVSMQIFWLLFANTFYADTNSSASTGMNTGLTTGAAVTGLEFLSNQLSNWISSDKFNLGFSYLPKGDLTSDELELRVSAPLLKDRLFLDVEGNYNFKNNQAYITENTKSFSGNVALTWLIRQSSNLSAKAFTRQIETFDENQGLQETGVGIYYKDDFNRFSDLVAKYRKNRAERLQLKTVKRHQIDSIGIEAYRALQRQKRYEQRNATK